MTNNTQPGMIPLGRHDRKTTPAAPPAAPAPPPYGPPGPAPQAPQQPQRPQEGDADQTVDSLREVPPPPPRPDSAVKQWWAASRGDSAARKARGGGKRAPIRWMREQPTSVADLLDYYLRQREQRPDGRLGWGLRTAIPVINEIHAFFYRLGGLMICLPATLIGYAAVWMQQRPGRALLLYAALAVAQYNLIVFFNA